MARVYLVEEGGGLVIVDRAIIDGVPYDKIGYPMERTDNTQELVGWPDTQVREWMAGPNTYLVPERR
jgi:hypothetical protein